MKQLLIIGGGAAGLAAAITAAQTAPEVKITLLEQHDRVGKKLLATGNGRCNLTNQFITPEHYHSGDREILTALLERFPTEMTTAFFSSLGLETTAEDMGRIYPYCKQAAMVLDVLLLWLNRLKVEVVTSCTVTSVTEQNGRFTARSADGRTFTGDRCILTAGGKASPTLGGDGLGYPLAESLGHTCTPLYPCLVPIRCKGAALKGLKGIRTHGTLTLRQGGQVLASDTGEVQLTEYGLSGIPALQLSCRLPQRGKSEIVLDLLPEWREEQVAQAISSRCARWPEEPLETFLLGWCNKKILYAVLKTLSIQPLSRTAGSLTGEEVGKLAHALKGWVFPVIGPLPWDSAQVTGGGVPLSEITPETMASRKQPGLYLAGELLDVAGDCGGYNLHWAWCSGIAAGRGAVS